MSILLWLFIILSTMGIAGYFSPIKTVKALLLSIIYILDTIVQLITFAYSILIYSPYILSTNNTPQQTPSEKQDKKPINVVIIGYSFAGFEIHKNLQDNPSLSHYKFTIIEPKAYFEYTPAILEVLTEPHKYNSISFPLEKCFDSTRTSLIGSNAKSKNDYKK
eukprot:151859_1